MAVVRDAGGAGQKKKKSEPIYISRPAPKTERQRQADAEAKKRRIQQERADINLRPGISLKDAKNVKANKQAAMQEKQAKRDAEQRNAAAANVINQQRNKQMSGRANAYVELLNRKNSSKQTAPRRNENIRQDRAEAAGPKITDAERRTIVGNKQAAMYKGSGPKQDGKSSTAPVTRTVPEQRTAPEQKTAPKIDGKEAAGRAYPKQQTQQAKLKGSSNKSSAKTKKKNTKQVIKDGFDQSKKQSKKKGKKKKG